MMRTAVGGLLFQGKHDASGSTCGGGILHGRHDAPGGTCGELVAFGLDMRHFHNSTRHLPPQLRAVIRRGLSPSHSRLLLE